MPGAMKLSVSPTRPECDCNGVLVKCSDLEVAEVLLSDL